jgi:hypothetical protein
MRTMMRTMMRRMVMRKDDGWLESKVELEMKGKGTGRTCRPRHGPSPDVLIASRVSVSAHTEPRRWHLITLPLNITLSAIR